MTYWKDLYKKRLCTVEEAAQAVISGDRIMNPILCGQPTNLIMDAIADRKDELKDVEYNGLITLRPYKLLKPEYRGSFKIVSSFLGSPPLRNALPESEGLADFIPMTVYSSIKQFTYYRPPSVVVLQVSPPDNDGFVNLGPDVCYTWALIEGCKTSKGTIGGPRVVIAEENEQHPLAFGHTRVHVSRFTHIVRNSSSPLVFPQPTALDAHHKIAKNVVSLLRDRDSIQIGFGALPMLVSDLITHSDLKDIGVMTEILPSGVPAWVEKGICTGKYRNFMPGKITAASALTTAELMEFCAKDDTVQFLSGDVTNDVCILGQEKQLVGINGALEIDLGGQISTISCGEKLFGGYGGQVDFAAGCRRSEFGRYIIATESVGRDKDRNLISRIVKFLKPGSMVNTPAQLVDFVVTEFGIAGPLEGRSIAERCEALIKIAHPDFQEELVRAAKERRIFK